MTTSFRKGELNVKFLILGVIAVIIVAAGIYFLSDSFGSSSGNAQKNNSQSIEEEYSQAKSSSAQRNEALFAEGENKTFDNQTLTILKIGVGSAYVKVGRKTEIVGSGKAYDIEGLHLNVRSVTFSSEAQYRRVIIDLNKSSNSSLENSSRSLGQEILLGEKETAKVGELSVSAEDITSDSVSVTVESTTKTISKWDHKAFDSVNVTVRDLFYNKQPGESKVALIVLPKGD